MQQSKIKLVRVTTISISLEKLLTGQMAFMHDMGFEVYIVCSPSNKTDDLAKREKSTFIPVKMTRIISPFADLVSLFKLIKIFYRLKPEIVHSHTPKAGLLSMMAAKITGVPIRLHTVAGLPLMETTGIKRKILEIVERITYWCASGVYPNSKNLMNFILKEKYCSNKKLKVIGNGSSNGINSTYYSLNNEVAQMCSSVKNKYNIKDDNFVFIFIGRVVLDKGIVELIQSYTKLKKDFPHIRLLLVGPFEPELDPLPEETLQIIKDDKTIIHTGYQEDVRPFLAASHVLAFPSYREGFPNVPMQAGCLHLPSIVTNINGCNEIIESEVNGLLVTPKNADELYTAMLRMLTDKSLYEQCKKNARDLIIAKYDQKHVWNLILNEYNQQLKR